MASLVESLISSALSDPNVQAKAVASAISIVMGFTPSVVSGNGYAEIVFTPAQEDLVVAYLNRLLGSSPAPAQLPGNAPVTPSVSSKIRINIKMILIRVFLKNYWYVLAGPFMGGFLTGRRTAKRK